MAKHAGMHWNIVVLPVKSSTSTLYWNSSSVWTLSSRNIYRSQSYVWTCFRFLKNWHGLNSFRWNHYYKQSDKITQRMGETVVGETKQERACWFCDSGVHTWQAWLSSLPKRISKKKKKEKKRNPQNRTLLPSSSKPGWCVHGLDIINLSLGIGIITKCGQIKSELSLVLRSGNLPALIPSVSPLVT